MEHLKLAEYIPTDTYKESVTTVSYFIYAFMGLCGLVAISARLHAFFVSKADDVRVMGVVFFSIYTWDFFADVVFLGRLGEQSAWILFSFSFIFILLPYGLNMVRTSLHLPSTCRSTKSKQKKEAIVRISRFMEQRHPNKRSNKRVSNRLEYFLNRYRCFKWKRLRRRRNREFKYFWI